MEVSKDELSKLMMVETKLANEIQKIRRASEPKPDKDKDNEQEGQEPVEERRRGERGGHPKYRRPLVKPLQPMAPARAVGGWCRDQHRPIHVRKRRFPRAYTQVRSG